MKTKKGFTLIEMIVVIILIGLIVVVAIPSVIKLMTAQTNEKYETHRKLVKEALDLYTIRYKGTFDNYPSATTYRINYDVLVNEDLIVEDGVECRGYIDLTKKKSNSYTYEYYLKCSEDFDDPNKTPFVDDFGTEPACNNKCVEIN